MCLFCPFSIFLSSALLLLCSRATHIPLKTVDSRICYLTAYAFLSGSLIHRFIVLRTHYELPIFTSPFFPFVHLSSASAELHLFRNLLFIPISAPYPIPAHIFNFSDTIFPFLAYRQSSRPFMYSTPHTFPYYHSKTFSSPQF